MVIAFLKPMASSKEFPGRISSSGRISSIFGDVPTRALSWTYIISHGVFSQECDVMFDSTDCRKNEQLSFVHVWFSMLVGHLGKDATKQFQIPLHFRKEKFVTCYCCTGG